MDTVTGSGPMESVGHALRSHDAHQPTSTLFTPEPDETLRFFIDLLSLDEVGRSGEWVYLRYFDDYEQFSVKVTARDRARISKLGLRAQSPEALQPALNQGHRRPSRGLGVRRLDHVNYLSCDVEANRDFQRDMLGAQLIEQIVLDDGTTPAPGSRSPTRL